MVTSEYFLHGKQKRARVVSWVVMEPLRQEEWGLFQMAVMEE